MRHDDAAGDLEILAARELLRGKGLAAGECPDAETLAAYADRSLDRRERARWNPHLSSCARCRGVLADLARSNPASAQPVPLQARIVPARWQWLVPAAAVVTAGVAWTLLQPRLTGPVTPTPRTTQDAGKPEAIASTGVARATPLGRGEPATQPAMAGAAARVPQPAAPAAPATGRGVTAAPAALAEARPATFVSVPDTVRAAAELPEAERRQQAARAAGAPLPVEPIGRTDRSAALVMEARPPAVPVREATGGIAATPQVIVQSPDSSIAWRIGQAGFIERTIDGGETWQRQASGVYVSLTAGSAPAPTVCWVVGEAGTVLRALDGRTWQRASVPAEAWLIAVTARDSLRAIVTDRNGQRYSTEDGGLTWTRLPPR